MSHCNLALQERALPAFDRTITTDEYRRVHYLNSIKNSDFLHHKTLPGKLETVVFWQDERFCMARARGGRSRAQCQ